MNRAIRVPFDKKDQDALAAFLARWSGSRKGNEAYKVFASTYTSHPWQSWRDHYIKNQELFEILIRKFRSSGNANDIIRPQSNGPINTKRARSSGTPLNPIVVDGLQTEATSQNKKNKASQTCTSSLRLSALEAIQSRPSTKSKSGPNLTPEHALTRHTPTLIVSSDSEPLNRIKKNKGKHKRRSSSPQSGSDVASSQHEQSRISRSTPNRNHQQMTRIQGDPSGISQSSHQNTPDHQDNFDFAPSVVLPVNSSLASRKTPDRPSRASVILNPEEKSAFHRYMSGFPTGDIRLKDQLYDSYYQIAPAHSPQAYRSYYLAHRRQLDVYLSPQQGRTSNPGRSTPIQVSPISNLGCAPFTSGVSQRASDPGNSNADTIRIPVQMRAPVSASHSALHSHPAMVTPTKGLAGHDSLSEAPVEDEAASDGEKSLSLSTGSSDDGNLQDILDRKIDHSRLKPCYMLHLNALSKLQEDSESSLGEKEPTEGEGSITNGLRIDGSEDVTVAPEPRVQKSPTTLSERLVSSVDPLFAGTDQKSTSAASNTIDPVLGQKQGRPATRIQLVEKSPVMLSDRPASSFDAQPVCTSPAAHSTDQTGQRSAAVDPSMISRTSTLCSSRRTRSGTARNIPSGPISMAVAIELMNEFLSEFGHIYSDSEAVALFKRCGDWTLMFEVGSLMAEEAAGVIKDEEEKQYMETVMAMVWEDEEDKLLETPVEQLSGRARRRLGVLEKRKGPQAIANRRVYLAALADA